MQLGTIHIGARMLKTALAVFLCLLVDAYTPGDIELGVHSCIATVICMMPTSHDTMQMGINRIIATTISFFAGAIVLTLYSIFPQWYLLLKLLLMPFFIIVIIIVCNKINRPGSVLLCCAIFIILAFAPAMSLQEAIAYSGLRFAYTVLGIVVAWLVNKFVYPAEKYHPELEECQKHLQELQEAENQKDEKIENDIK